MNDNDKNAEIDSGKQAEPSFPEPPVRYDPDAAETYEPPQQPDASDNTRRAPDISSARTFLLIGAAAAPVSFFFGGSLLSAVGLVLCIIGRRKLVKALEGLDGKRDAYKSILRASVFAIALCAVALVVNAVAAYLYYPVLLEQLTSGNPGQMLGGGTTGGGSGTSTWG